MSSNLLKGSLFFISGAAISSFITYKVVEKKFKEIADEEIESVKEMYERKLERAKSSDNTEKTEQIEMVFSGEVDNESSLAKVTVNPYSSLVDNLGYSNIKKEENEEMENNVPNYNVEVIPPEDFGEREYKCESLTYYKDRILTFDNDEKITNIERYVGYDALNTFGEYEDDSVFVRNHDLKTDFEILRDSRTYLDVVGTDE